MNWLRNGSVGLRLSALTVLMAGALGVVGAVAWYDYEHHGVAAAAVAAALCWAGAVSALCLDWALRTRGHPLTGVIAGMGARMGPALFGAASAASVEGGLVEVGFLEYLILFFETALFLQIGFLTPMERATPHRSRVPTVQDIERQLARPTWRGSREKTRNRPRPRSE